MALQKRRMLVFDLDTIVLHMVQGLARRRCSTPSECTFTRPALGKQLTEWATPGVSESRSRARAIRGAAFMNEFGFVHSLNMPMTSVGVTLSEYRYPLQSDCLGLVAERVLSA